MNIPFRQHAGYDPLGDCGKGRCPVCARNSAVMRVKQTLHSTNFQSEGVAPFIGRYGYPRINVGILAPPQPEEEAWLYDAPKHWAFKDFQIPRIVDFRSSLLNSRSAINIKSKTKLLELSQEVGMASAPADVEITLEKVPSFRINMDSHSAPTGPAAALKQAKLTSNPSIHTKVQKVFSDTDWKAREALVYLYENNFDENFLSRMFSVGTMGLKMNRKLVPTRWSLTAVDDSIGKNLIESIKGYQQYTFAAYFGGYLGNYFLVLFFPEAWSYELFEMYAPSNAGNMIPKYTTDFEDVYGRKTYVEETAGGYYASRLPVLEKLDALRRQASCLVLRFITDEYTMPLGVWVVRESVRKSLSSKPIEFSDPELMLSYAKTLAKKKFGLNIEQILRKSRLLEQVKHQSKLLQFL